jgi:hypothetical protein
MTEDMVKEVLKWSRRQRKGREKTFRRVLAWRKLVFRLVELVNQSKEKDCEGLRESPMICIGD